MRKRLIEAEVKIAQYQIQLQQDQTKTTEQINKELQDFAEQTRGAALVLGTIDRAIEKFKKSLESVAVIKETVKTFQDGFKNVVNTVLNAGDITEAVNSLLNTVKNKLTEHMLDVSTRPLKDVMEKTFLKWFNLDAPDKQFEEKLQAIRDEVASNSLKVDTQALRLDQERNKILTNIQNNLTESEIDAGLPSNTNATALPVVPLGETLTESVAPAIDAVGVEAQNAANNLKTISSAGTAVPQQLSNFQKTLGAAITGLGGVTMAISGAQQMKQGGTHNTLMGLASIFGSIASLGSMFIPGGLFGKALPGRALGGPVRPNTPYLVGESGPELVLPENGGTVFSNSRSRQLLSTLSDKNNTLAANQQRSANPSPRNLQITHTYQAEVINNVEYVTADQFRKGMAESSERGKLLTIQALQNSVGTRRRLAL